MMIIMSMSFMLSITFIFMNHPLSMGLILILQTISISMMLGMIKGTFWFSYILLITMISGALVLFIYMASVASNEKFSTPWKMISINLAIMSCMVLASILTDQMLFIFIWSVKMEASTMHDMMASLSKLFSSINMSMTMLLVVYLFITMIVVNYIVTMFDGPLRPKF
uniref:NADH dehydrogenase subunit 6 n=1 Tax=Neocentrocnemis stali TaxID=888042 RepID=A0A7I6HBR2_9HEMI|nr:NADH dehydrogenase subunit 6 [Neocentrocnemis stali]AGO28036.1 NADH dehydrogenase subunit 6 [Neocentrocnemis stali]